MSHLVGRSLSPLSVMLCAAVALAAPRVHAAAAADTYEPDDSFDTPSAITLGETQTRSIAPAGDNDYVMFTLSQTTDLVIETDGPEGATFLRLYFSNRSLIESDTDSGNGDFSRIFRVGDQALAAGSYFIRVTKAGLAGEIPTYTLRLDTHSGPLPPQITNITNFNIAEGVPFTTPPPGLEEGTPPVTWSLVSGPPGATINAGTGEVTWPNPTLGSSSVTIMAMNSVGSDTDSFTFTVSPPAADIWEPDDTAAQATLLFPDDPKIHTIIPVGDQDWHLFTVDHTQTTILETSSPIAGDTVMELYQEDGTTLIEMDDDDGPGNFSRIERSGADGLPEGTYLLRIYEKGNDSTINQYTVTYTAQIELDAFEPDDTPAEANTIPFGTPQAHSILPAGDVDWVKFTLGATSDVTLETAGDPAGDTVMGLYESDGTTLIEQNDDGGAGSYSLIERTGMNALPAGTYLAKIRGFSAAATEIEHYTITVTGPPDPLQPYVDYLLGITSDDTGLDANSDGTVDIADLTWKQLHP